MKILFITNIPSPYRVKFFNELGKYCDLTVIFERERSKERDKSWQNYKFDTFKGVFLKGIKIGADSAFCPKIIKYLKKDHFDHIILSSFSSPTGWLAILFMRIKKMAYILESDGGFAKSGKGLKERIKKFFIHGAQLYFSTAEEHDLYYLTYGAEKDRIVRYPFTSIKEGEILSEPLTAEKKAELRKENNITEKYVVLAVGQFIHRKGLDVLLKASLQIPTDTGVYFIGGEPTEEMQKFKNDNNLGNVHFIPFIKSEELKNFYCAADVFVLPTREDIWGLVVNEAMACGLPVVTTERCIAGVELVTNDENGYIVSVDNEEEIVCAIERIRENGSEKMSMVSLNKIREYTIEKMAKRHIEVLENRRNNDKCKNI